MSEDIVVSPQIAATIITGVLAIGGALVGIIYRTLRNRVSGVEDDTGGLEERLDRIENQMSTLFAWAFGNEEDSTDRGISQDIEEGFRDLHDRHDDLEEKSDDRHDETMELVRSIVDELHDEEALDFDRDDVE